MKGSPFIQIDLAKTTAIRNTWSLGVLLCRQRSSRYVAKFTGKFVRSTNIRMAATTTYIDAKSTLPHSVVTDSPNMWLKKKTKCQKLIKYPRGVDYSHTPWRNLWQSA